MVRRCLAAAVCVLALGGASTPVGAQEVPSGPADATDIAPGAGGAADDAAEFGSQGSLGTEDGVPMGFVTPDGMADGIGSVGGVGGFGIPVALAAASAMLPGVSSVPVSDDYLQVTQMLEQQNMARRALEAAERARREAELRRALAARNRGDRVPDDVPYAKQLNDAGAAQSVDPRMLAAVAKVSSGLRAGAGCPGGTRRGLMGLTPDVAASYGIDPCDPAQAAGASALLLRGLYERYGSWDPALAAFRVGAAEVDRAKGVPASARGFVSKVNSEWQSYKDRAAGDSNDSGSGGYAKPPKGVGPEQRSSGPNGPVCTKRAAGFTVACHIAPNVAAMVAAAAGDGVRLSGGAYRDHQNQITLRRAHCGPSQYDIYEKPSSQCRPPTARPGRSMHERGEAIDFNACSSRGTACHQWLKRRGAEFGFFNLPSEPWHWSTNGN